MLDFDLSPYYDDFFATNGAQQNGYMQILFKPGFAVQARELTQMQTILQNQIGEFANNVFINGSLVSGAEITYDNSITSIQLQPYQGNLPITLQDFNNKLIVNYNSGPQIIRAKVVAIDTSLSSNTSAGALAVKYLTGIEFADGVEIQTVVTGGETSSIATLLSANSTTSGSIVSINGGVFFVNGYFVTVAPQTIILNSLSNTKHENLPHGTFISLFFPSILFEKREEAFFTISFISCYTCSRDKKSGKDDFYQKR